YWLDNCWPGRRWIIALAHIVDEDETSASEVDSEDINPEVGDKGACITLKAKIPTKCPSKNSYLCINSPKGSTVDSRTTITGTINKNEKGFSHVSGMIQNKYTNEIVKIKEEDLKIEDNGEFSLGVELPEYGPYSVTIKATPVIGSMEEKVVKLSRVKAVGLDPTDIKTTPNIENTDVVNSCLNISVDLLHGCKNCDFVGASTNGVLVTAIDTVTGADDEYTFKEETSLNSNGIFDISVQVKDGDNNIVVYACNAATGFERDGCPQVSLKTFKGVDGSIKVEIIEPDIKKNKFISGEKIPLKFKVHNMIEKFKDSGDGSCTDDMVTWQFNRGQLTNLCPNGSGIYETVMDPIFGINVGTVRVQTPDGLFREPVVFGWGDKASTRLKDGAIPNAVQLKFSKDLLVVKIASLIKEGIAAGSLKDFLSSFVKDFEIDQDVEDVPVKVEEDASLANQILEEMDGCSAGEKNNTAPIFTVGKSPELEKITLENFDITDEGVDFKIKIEGLKVWILITKDKDEDGLFDLEPLPLKLSFAELALEGRVMVQGDSSAPMLVIQGSGSDCDYLEKDDCKDKAVLFTPKNFKGDATKWGDFIICDEDYPDISDDLAKRCMSLNAADVWLNGKVSKTLLKLVNDMAYCKGSAFITSMIREALSNKLFDIPLPDDRKISIATTLRLSEDGFKLSSEEGLSFKGDALITTPNDEVEFLIDPTDKGISDLSMSLGEDVKFAISESLINSALAGVTGQVGADDLLGALDWDIDEAFFNRLGIDFVEKCDEVPQGEEPSVLCNFRPRVREFLTGVPDYILSPDQPLLIRLRGSSDITPHVRFNPELPPQFASTVEGDIVDLTIGTLNMTIYPIDEDGEIISMNEFSREPTPIVQLKLSAMVALEIRNVIPNPDNKDEYLLKMILRGDMSRIVIVPVPGTNTSGQTDAKLMSEISGALELGISENREFNIKIPKIIDLTTFKKGGDIFKMLGLEKISFGPNGPKLGIDSTGSYLEFGTDFQIN
ncbi:hypothetical protein KKA47_02775, partial [bacterium]|nr:hypothetical protein [bacterium]